MSIYSELIIHEDFLARLVVDKFFYNYPIDLKEVLPKFLDNADFDFYDRSVGIHYLKLIYDYEPTIISSCYSNELLNFAINHGKIDLQSFTLALREYLFSYLGKMIKSSPEWESHLKQLKKNREKLREIKRIMTS